MVYEQTTWSAPSRRRGRTARTVAIAAGAALLACCAGTTTAVLVTGAIAPHGASTHGASTRAASTAGGTVVDGQPAAAEPPGLVPPGLVPPGLEPPGLEPPGLDDPVRDGQFEFTVHGVTCGHDAVGEKWWRREAQGEFCIVELTVRNVGTEARHFADGAQRAKGPEGNTYAADTGAGVIVNGTGDAVWNVVNPGNSITAKIVYDVPPGATFASLELHDSVLSGGVTVELG